MAEADELQHQLLRAQNPDGGWGYENTSSWTEPTALSLLALEARNACGAPYQRGHAWLAQIQRSDGGWPPKPSVPISTWVTSLATLALSGDQSAAQRRRGVNWLLSQITPEPGLILRLAAQIRERPVSLPQGGGSPWFPGTAAWVSPTASSILAFSAARKEISDLQPHIHRAREYLLSRRCSDGGWNHGGSKYRSENANSYPETTGMALLALHGLPVSELSVSLRRAQALLESPGSAEGLSWLQLGLFRHGVDALDTNISFECRTTRDVSLRLLALEARSSTNKLVVEL